MKPSKIASKKRPRPTGNKRPTASKKGSLSLDFVQGLLEESLLKNGLLGSDDDASRSSSVSGDKSEDDDLRCRDEKDNVPLEDCYEVKELPGKGFGVIAKISIPSGAVVFSEAPLFILLASTPMPVSFSALNALIAAQGLSPDVKIAISRLANVYPTATTHPAIGILKTNSLPVTMKDAAGKEKRAGGLFETVCRINHSCVPNAVARWERRLGERGEMRVKAKRVIEVNEEITISYGVPAEHLKEKFGFDCDCEKCAQHPLIPGRGGGL